MLTKKQIKLIKSLYLKKYRQKHKLFIAEGTKVFKEFIEVGWELYLAIATEQWCKENNFSHKNLIVEDYQQIKKLSCSVTPQQILGVFKQKNYKFSEDYSKNKWGVLLTNIQDPGNAGTIIRSALWFGIDYVVFSENSVDIYNPKLVQASMGSIAKIKIFHTDNYLELLKSISNNVSLYVAEVEGEPLYSLKEIPGEGIIIIGNESKGVDKKVYQFSHKKIFIPSYSEKIFDSLNAAMSASIIFYEIMKLRKKLT